MSSRFHRPRGGVLRHGWAALGVALAVLTTTVIGTAAAAAAVHSGTSSVVAPDGTPLQSGGSATAFTLRLPENAACPGDSEHHGYLVYGYVAPSNADPGTLTFPGGYPSSGLDLITVHGEPFKTRATAVLTGSILQPPGFVWSRYDHHSDVLPPGTYDVGIACAFQYGHVASYWNTKVTILASSTDPGGFTWQVTGFHAGRGGGWSNGALILGVTLVGALVVVGGVTIGLRNRTLRDALRRPVRRPTPR
jgi:hypothetical protein